MKTTRCFTVLGAATFPLIVLFMLNGSGCKKEETEAPPAPTPTPVSTPTPVTTVTPEEDAGLDAGEDADASDASDAKKPSGNFDPTGLKQCCSALRQNAKSAPLDQQAGYLAAAGACDGMVATQQSRQALASLRSFLRGASLPGGCQ